MTTKIDQTFLDEMVGILQDYIRIDTTNPPGNEEMAAKFLKEILEKEGINVTIEAPSPHRANLIATLKGQGKGKPIILLNHMDVVPAEASQWSVPPFSGEIRDGYLYGRGALDMKGMGVLELMTILYLKRKGVILDHDLIFLAVADEETGGIMGTKWMLDRHPELFEVDGIFNEGGGGVFDQGKNWYEVSTSQKVLCQVQISTKGEGGHASVPKGSSAIAKLLSALEKIQNHTFSPILIPTVTEYYRRIAPLQKKEWQPIFQDMEDALRRGEPLLKEILADPLHHSMTHHTAAITVLRAGEKVNVIPTEAMARVDCRLIPGTDPDDFITTLKEIVNDPNVKIEGIFKGINVPPSPHNTPLFHAIERAVGLHDPGSIVAPHLVPGATDSRYFRAAGIPCYDFIPFRLPIEERMLIHGIDERVSLENLRFGVEVMIDIILNL